MKHAALIVLACFVILSAVYEIWRQITGFVLKYLNAAHKIRVCFAASWTIRLRMIVHNYKSEYYCNYANALTTKTPTTFLL